MFGTLLSVFLDVVLPVFGVVGAGYLLGPRLKLEARTLSRTAFYLFVPAFVFNVISSTHVEAAAAGRMAAFVVVSCALFALLGFLAARLMRCTREMTAAFVMVSVFGNVGNFGLALVDFRLGPEGLAPATIFFVFINIVAFGTAVVAAAWAAGGGMAALLSILKTPGLMAVGPAVIVSYFGIELPPTVTRIVGLLAQAMIPVMLVALGLQLSEAEGLKVGPRVAVASMIRLVAAPMIAWAIIGFFGISGMDASAGIIQSGMPVAVLVSIVAIEYRVEPTFVTTTVFFTTVMSLPTLSILLSII